MIRHGVVLGLVLLLVQAALLPAAADQLDNAVHRVAEQLNCPVCAGQSVADSNSGLAADMRKVIRQRLSEGQTDRQILASFQTSYGDGILREPPKAGITLGVWIGPVVGLAAAAVALVVLLGLWLRKPTALQAPLPIAALDPAVEDELRGFRAGALK